MSMYERASHWFGGLDVLDRSAVLLALGGGPLPRWLADSLAGAEIPTVVADIPNGTVFRSANFMTAVLTDFLTHEGPTLPFTSLRPRSTQTSARDDHHEPDTATAPSILRGSVSGTTSAVDL